MRISPATNHKDDIFAPLGERPIAGLTHHIHMTTLHCWKQATIQASLGQVLQKRVALDPLVGRVREEAATRCVAI